MKEKLFCLILILCLALCPVFSACSKSGDGVPGQDGSGAGDSGAEGGDVNGSGAGSGAGGSTVSGDADRLTMFHEAKESAAEALAARMEKGRESKDDHMMILSYDTKNIYIHNAAFAYDNALALMAFISEDRQADAKQLADTFVYAVNNDRSGKIRVRNAYAGGSITAVKGMWDGAKMPGWYDETRAEWLEDRYQVGSNAGNTSYVALALLQYHNKYGGDEYLETARALMDWVLDNCSTGSGDGFTAGFDGWEEADPPVVYPFTYKSIEHNIDAFAAFSQLYGDTGEAKYHDAAESAKRFVESMYDSGEGLFMTGTLDAGVTPTKSVVVLDAQVWAAMALGDSFNEYKDALKVVEKMKTDEGGYPFCVENKNGGWWAEGTAYTALMYRERGDEKKYAEAMSALEAIQLKSGLFPAATTKHLSTGMELFDGSPWEYSDDPHIAPAAWFVMAANGFNPYTFEDID